MRALHYAGVGFFFLAIFIAGCVGHGTAMPPLPGGSASSSQRQTRMFHPNAADTLPWCDSRVTASGTDTINCILEASQTQTATVKVPVDEADPPGTKDSCGPVTWSIGSPNPAISISLTTPSPGNTSCTRVDTVSVTVTRLANEPQPSPSPGMILYQALIGGSDLETGETGESNQQGSGAQMPGTGGVGKDGIADLQFNVVVFAPPALQITDIDTPSSPVVSSPAPIPSPLMVGQQVQLEATPAPGGVLTDANGDTPNPYGTPEPVKAWTIDPTPSVTNVVASYSPSQSPVVASPEPLGSQGESLTSNPLVMYFLSSGTKKVKVSAYVGISVIGVNADEDCAGGGSGIVHVVRGHRPEDTNSCSIIGDFLETAETNYTIDTPTVTKSKATSTAVSQVSTYYETSQTNVSCKNLTGMYSFFFALHAGDLCLPHGIDWSFQVTTPAWGAGNIAVVQLSDIKINGIVNGATAGPWEQSGLDQTYPYSAWAPTSGGLAAPTFDAPSSNLDITPCSTETRNDSFTDYFMYQASSPAPGNAGRGSIPVTLRQYAWAWGGTTTRPTPSPQPSPSPTFGPATAVTNPSPTAAPTPYGLPSWSLIPNLSSAPC